MRSSLLALSLLAALGCVAPKFLIDIPANATPARYYHTQDAANLLGGAALDELARTWWPGPVDHVGMGDRQIGTTSQVQPFTFRWRAQEDAPLKRIGLVILAGGIRRQTDRGYRESGWLFDVGGALLNEWLHMMTAAIAGHFPSHGGIP